MAAAVLVVVVTATILMVMVTASALMVVVTAAVLVVMVTAAVLVVMIATAVLTAAGVILLFFVGVVENAVFAVRNVQLFSQSLDQLFGHKDARLGHQLCKLFVGVWLLRVFTVDNLL